MPSLRLALVIILTKKIIGLYGLEMSYSDNQKHMKEMHDFEVSVDVISHIKDQILPEIKEFFRKHLFFYISWCHALQIQRWRTSQE